MIGNGTRSSSSAAYLTPVLNRPNLHVLIDNTVTRLVQSGSTKGTPVFNKVEFASSSSGKSRNVTLYRPSTHSGIARRTTVTAQKEVILSAGAIGTPQILMLSGIGNPTELKPLGIKPVVNLPDVGQNLQDHPIMSNYFTVNSNGTFDDVLRDASLSNADLAQWIQNRTGLFSQTTTPALAFLRLPPNSSIFKTVPDPAAGPNTGHIELLWANNFIAINNPMPATGNFMTINTAVVTPTSRGNLRLASSDPFTFPIINPNFFNTTFDQTAMVSAVRAARTFISKQPWQGFITGNFGEVGAAQTDAEIIAASRDEIVSIWHPTSTARMSPANAAWGVVDPQLRVKGIKGLRIVDASIFVSCGFTCHLLADANVLRAAYHSRCTHHSPSVYRGRACRGFH